MQISNRALAGIAAAALLLLAHQPASAQMFTGPQGLMRVHAYDGPRRPASQLATVFAPYGSTAVGFKYMCKADGKNYNQPFRPISTCPSVYYLLPGTHVVQVAYRRAGLIGFKDVTVRAEAGRTYQVFVIQEGRKAAFGIRAMPPGFALTYKDLNPSHFVTGNEPNSRVDPAAE